jgi:hypothetical protein
LCACDHSDKDDLLHDFTAAWTSSTRFMTPWARASR